jgi:hypothetical protein
VPHRFKLVGLDDHVAKLADMGAAIGPEDHARMLAPVPPALTHTRSDNAAVVLLDLVGDNDRIDIRQHGVGASRTLSQMFCGVWRRFLVSYRSNSPVRPGSVHPRRDRSACAANQTTAAPPSSSPRCQSAARRSSPSSPTDPTACSVPAPNAERLFTTVPRRRGWCEFRRPGASLARFDARFGDAQVGLKIFVEKKIAEDGDPPRRKPIEQFPKSLGLHGAQSRLLNTRLAEVAEVGNDDVGSHADKPVAFPQVGFAAASCFVAGDGDVYRPTV